MKWPPPPAEDWRRNKSVQQPLEKKWEWISATHNFWSRLLEPKDSIFSVWLKSHEVFSVKNDVSFTSNGQFRASMALVRNISESQALAPKYMLSSSLYTRGAEQCRKTCITFSTRQKSQGKGSGAKNNKTTTIAEALRRGYVQTPSSTRLGFGRLFPDDQTSMHLSLCISSLTGRRAPRFSVLC